MNFGNFILGIIITAIGFLFVWKTEWLLINFGRIGFAEKHLTSEGGSRLMYKFFGALIIFFGLMHAVDLSDNFFGWLVNLIFGNSIKQL